jgi:hypothetical protein
MYMINRYKENPLGKKTHSTLVLSLLLLSVVPLNDNLLHFVALLSDLFRHAIESFTPGLATLGTYTRLSIYASTGSKSNLWCLHSYLSGFVALFRTSL